MVSQDSISKLPDPKQTWAHSTTTIQELSDALNDPKITAIETDIVMGCDVNSDGVNQPIMAHPPSTESDLSFTSFLKITTSKKDEHSLSSSTSPPEPPMIQKHLKLDLKEIQALDPILDGLGAIIKDLNHGVESKTIYLNADIIRGPGMRNDSLPITPDNFLNPCMKFLKEDTKRQNVCAFSLGWKTDCRSFTGYTNEDVEEMKNIIEKFELLEFSKGVVLAVNARVLAKDPKPFDSLLKELPQVQLLIWTGTGEPPISKGKIDAIHRHFEMNGFIDQIGFDCQIAPSFVVGLFYDKAVDTIGTFWNVNKFISQKLS